MTKKLIVVINAIKKLFDSPMDNVMSLWSMDVHSCNLFVNSFF